MVSDTSDALKTPVTLKAAVWQHCMSRKDKQTDEFDKRKAICFLSGV